MSTCFCEKCGTMILTGSLCKRHAADAVKNEVRQGNKISKGNAAKSGEKRRSGNKGNRNSKYLGPDGRPKANMGMARLRAEDKRKWLERQAEASRVYEAALAENAEPAVEVDQAAA